MTATEKSPQMFLLKGAHDELNDGACAMELTAWLAGEPHSDHPKCVSPVLGAFMRSWNDSLDDATRQKLLPYCIRVIGTNTGKQDDETRAWMATDWLVRVQAPAWLDLAGRMESAAKLRALPPLTSSNIALACQSVIEHARQDAAAAGSAARAAAWAAAWAAARAAAGAAAGSAARAAAWAAAGDAAWAAAWDAAGDAAWAAAWAAAKAAAWAAAGKSLAPTVAELQASAFLLLDRMIAVGQKEEVECVEERVCEFAAAVDLAEQREAPSLVGSEGR